MRGLENLGNTCYFNSALQCILQTPQLTNFLIENDYSGDCEFTKEYQNVTRGMWLGQDAVNPEKLHNLFTQKYTQFDNRNQHDSQEAFLCILDILSKSLTKIIRDIFYGINVQETVCKSGRSTIKEDFNIVILQPKPEEDNIVDILKSSQNWTGIKDYEDSNGKTWPVAATRTVFEQLPLIFVFSIQMYNSKKKIKFFDTLEIGEQTYSLYATSNHQGSIHGGHYISFTKHKDQWYLKDDAMVYKTSEFPNCDYHYLAFYKSVFHTTTEG